MGSTVARSQYPEEVIEAALVELACWRGNYRRAAAALAERGIRVPAPTLYTWKRIHAERLAELEEEVLPKIRSRLAVEQERIAQRSAEVTLKVLDRLKTEVHKIPARDLGGTARNTEVVSATAIDKHSILHGLPTEIRQSESAEDVLKRLQAKHPGMFIDSTAEEIGDAEVVEEKPRRGAQRQLSPASSTANARSPHAGSSADEPDN